MLMVGGGAAAGAFGVAARARRRHPDRAAADARVRAAVARSRRGLAGVRDHDEQRRRRRVPRAPRREPAPRDVARAVHGVRRARRRLDRVPARRADPVAAVRVAARLRRVHDGPRPPRSAAGRAAGASSRDPAAVVHRGGVADEAHASPRGRARLAVDPRRPVRRGLPGAESAASASSGRRSPASSRRCSASVAGSSRCR